MVLPAPPPDDAPRPREASWLTRLNGVLQLVQKGVLVLIDEAHPERLGELVRSLLPTHPDLEVHTDAVRLARAEKGSLIVLVPDPAQATWLNLERPIFANRALRVILFSTAETSSVLARRAPDFFSWISHRIECPPGPVLPAVRGIQAALRTRARGIAWTGGDLEGAFHAALPGRALVRSSAAMPYEQMVEAAKPDGKSWVVWSEVDGPFRLRRVRWAMAEAGRRGRSVLLEPAVEAPGFLRGSGQLADIKAACTDMEAGGAKHAGRLAALLDLDPELIKLACSLLMAGEAEANITAAALAAKDPRQAIEQLAADRKIGAGATRHEAAGGRGDTGEALLIDRDNDERRWVKAAMAAIEADDAEVATFWGKRALLLSDEDQEALQVAGDALERLGAYAQAETLLRKAIDLAEGAKRIDQGYVASLISLGRALMSQSHLQAAEKLLRKAVTILKRDVGSTRREYANAIRVLAVILKGRGRYEEAEKMLREAISITKQIEGKKHPNYATLTSDLGTVLLARGKRGAAEALFRESLAILEKTLGIESHQYATVAHNLGRCLLDEHKYLEAETSLRMAAAIYEKILGRNSPRYAASLHELARCHTRQGVYGEAQIELRRVLSIYESSIGARTLPYAASLNQLAVIDQFRGNHTEAEQMFRLALSIVQEIGGEEHPALCASLSNLGLVLAARGQLAEGEDLVARSIEIAKKFDSRNPEIGSTLLTLARVQTAHGVAEAPATARRALDAIHYSHGPKSPEYKDATEFVETLAHAPTNPTAPPGPRRRGSPRTTPH